MSQQAFTAEIAEGCQKGKNSAGMYLRCPGDDVPVQPEKRQGAAGVLRCQTIRLLHHGGAAGAGRRKPEEGFFQPEVFLVGI